MKYIFNGILILVLLLLVSWQSVDAAPTITGGWGDLRVLSAQTLGYKQFCWGIYGEYSAANMTNKHLAYPFYPTYNRDRYGEDGWVYTGIQYEGTQFATGSASVTYGLLSVLDLSLTGYYYYDAWDGDPDNPDVATSTSGLGDIVASAKLRLPHIGWEILTTSAYVFSTFPTGSSNPGLYRFYSAKTPDFGIKLLFTFNPILMPWEVHLNLGYVDRNGDWSEIDPLIHDVAAWSNALLIGSAFEYKATSKLSLFLEYNAEQIVHTPTDNHLYTPGSLTKMNDDDRIWITPGFRLGTDLGFAINAGVDIGITEATPSWNFAFGLTCHKETDADGDGIKDDKDRCPEDPEDYDGFEDKDGCPDYDNDQDGIVDVTDNCPDDPEDEDNWEDEDGCPDYDNDQDGIVDLNDDCPDNAETFNKYKDKDGCPDTDLYLTFAECQALEERGEYAAALVCINDMLAEVQAEDQDELVEASRDLKSEIEVTMQELEKRLEILMYGVYFPLDGDEISDFYKEDLQAAAKVLNAYPELNIEIQGHTDNWGTELYNQGLSERRANAVRNYLISLDVDINRMSINGYSEGYPVIDNSSIMKRQLNRRAVMKILNPEALAKYSSPDIAKQ